MQQPPPTDDHEYLEALYQVFRKFMLEDQRKYYQKTMDRYETSAKQVNKILVVDSKGHSIDLGGGWPLYLQIRPTNATPAAAPSGSYLLLFPVMERGVPMQPGRYFTDSRVACWSWALSTEGCVTVEQLPPSWERTRSRSGAMPSTVASSRFWRTAPPLPA